MTAGSDGDDPNVIVSSLSFTEETTASNKHQLTISTGTLTSLPILPLELIEEEILCRLPVKLLLQLQCICKSWNSLISHPKFAKKHLHFSKKRHHLIVCHRNNLDEIVLLDSPISSVFSSSKIKQTQLSYPITGTNDIYYTPKSLSSCDGIICLANRDNSAVLWNSSIRKFKILPPLENPRQRVSYSFGYDHFIDNYKIIGISLYTEPPEVSVLTLGDDYLRRIQDFPYGGHIHGPVIFVSGTVNWSVYEPSGSYSLTLVSLDLEKELFQKLPQPDWETCLCTLGVLTDCLSIFASGEVFLDVWIMKEYGNKESWTKLYTVHYNSGNKEFAKILYVSEDYQMVMYSFDLGSDEWKFLVYDSKNDTLNIADIQNIINIWMHPIVYIESLISPSS